MQATRDTHKQTVTAALAVGDSDTINYSGFAGGHVHVPSGATATTLTWHASHDDGSTFQALNDGAGAAVTSTVAADKAVPIPDECFGARMLRATANNASVELTVILKS